MPISGTSVAIALEVNDNKKIADVSKNEIRWFSNNQLIASGAGLKNIIYTVPSTAAGDTAIKVVIINYRGANLEKFSAIPITNPEVVIESPYPEEEISKAVSVFRAVPYFFNVVSLENFVFTWLANNQPATDAVGNSNILTLDTNGSQTGDQVIISVTTTNTKNGLESAQKTSVLKIR